MIRFEHVHQNTLKGISYWCLLENNFISYIDVIIEHIVASRIEADGKSMWLRPMIYVDILFWILGFFTVLPYKTHIDKIQIEEATEPFFFVGYSKYLTEYLQFMENLTKTEWE